MLPYVRKILRAKGDLKLASKEEQGPCQRGYVQRGFKDLDGRNVPNCIPDPDKKD